MKEKTNISIIFKWVNRLVATFGLIAIGIVILVLRTIVLSPEVISVLLTGIIAGLTYNGTKNHNDIKSAIKTLEKK